MIPNQYIGGGRFSHPREYAERAGFDVAEYKPVTQKSLAGKYGYFSGCVMHWIPLHEVSEVEKTGQHKKYGKLIQWGM